MTYTVAAVTYWRPESLAERGAILGTGTEYMAHTLDSAWRAADDIAASGWTGEAATQAYARVERENRMGMRIVTAVLSLVDALNVAAPLLRSARDHAIASVTAARDDGFTVGEDWQVGPTPDNRTEEQRSNHIARISSALRQLTDIDRSMSVLLDGKLDEVRALQADAAAGREYTPPPSTTSMSPEDVTAMIDDPRFREWAEHHPDAAKLLLDSATDAGQLDPATKFYSDFLQRVWQREALERAGIDAGSWRPELGSEANKDTIVKVYQYYGRLFLDHPELQWAGMANMIGPSFAGGFFDLEMMQDLGHPFDGPGNTNGPVGTLTETEVRFYETTLLGMQKNIFNDQASMHEAYLTGGIGEMDRMLKAGLIDPKTFGAWERINEGTTRHDDALIAQGNRDLLWREQMQVIAEDYDRMRDRPNTGGLVTWGMTTVGAPSIPGAHSFAEEFPKIVDAPGPLPGRIETPFPDGNVSYRDERWQLITQDTLPAYQRLLADEPERARGIIASDFATRMQEQRLSHRWDDILGQLATNWGYRP